MSRNIQSSRRIIVSPLFIPWYCDALNAPPFFYNTLTSAPFSISPDGTAKNSTSADESWHDQQQLRLFLQLQHELKISSTDAAYGKDFECLANPPCRVLVPIPGWGLGPYLSTPPDNKIFKKIGGSNVPGESILPRLSSFVNGDQAFSGTTWWHGDFQSDNSIKYNVISF